MQLTVPAVGTAPGGVTSLTCQAWKRNTKYPAGRERDRRRITRLIATRTRPNTASADRRHAFGSGLMDAGGAVDVVAELMGHMQMSSSQVYLHPDPARLRAAVDQVPGPREVGAAAGREKAGGR